MDEVTTVKEASKKRPFLRRGTGLKRFYKDLDIENNHHVQERFNKVTPNNYPLQGHNFYEPMPIPSVLKSADSPKRNLNVRFTHHSSTANHRQNNAAGSDSDDEKSMDKENRNTHEHWRTSQDEVSTDSSVDEGEWETDDEDDDDGTESVVEINESLVDEVFKSILKTKAQRELFPFPNEDKGPVLDKPGINAAQPPFQRLETNTNTHVLNYTHGREKVDFKGQGHTVPFKFSFPANSTSSPNSKAMARELEMFERMEQFTTNQSFCSTASTVCRFVNTELCISPQPDTAAPPQPSLQVPIFKSASRQPPPLQVPTFKSALPVPAVPPPAPALPPPAHVPLFKPTPPRFQADADDFSPQLPIWNPAIELRKEQLTHDDQYLRALLTTRIHQLESEIDKHRTENKRIVQLRESLEKKSTDLERSRSEFQLRQSKELEVIDELKRRLKLDQEKVNRELSQTRKLKSAGDETEGELKSLRVKVVELEKEVKVRSSRWASSARNFKATIEDLNVQNDKLQKSVVELKNDKMKLNARLRKSGKSSAHPPDVVPTPPTEVNVPAPVGAATLDPVTTGGGERESKAENGATRIFSADGQCLEVRYPNGDIKDLRELEKTGVRKYYFKAADSWEIIHPDGTETLQFGTGEVQTKLPSGIHETKYASGAVRRLFPDGMEECLFPDKTLIRTGSEGEKEIHLPNGQVEYQSKNIKIRIYPDGTEKVLYNNGSALTRYASGRQRFRDATGQIVYDRLGGGSEDDPSATYRGGGSIIPSPSSVIS